MYCFYWILAFSHSCKIGDSSSGFIIKKTFDGCYVLGIHSCKESLSPVFQSEF